MHLQERCVHYDLIKDGWIRHKEFHHAMEVLNFDAQPAVINELFDQWDADGSGELDFREINKLLRPPSAKAAASAKAKIAAAAPSAAPRKPVVVPKHPAVREALEALRIVKAAQPPWMLSPAPSWLC